jgi:hypothetical protein
LSGKRRISFNERSNSLDVATERERADIAAVARQEVDDAPATRVDGSPDWRSLPCCFHAIKLSALRHQQFGRLERISSPSDLAIAIELSATLASDSRVEHKYISGCQPFGPRSFSQSSPAASFRWGSGVSQSAEAASGRLASTRATSLRLPHTTSVQKLSCPSSG